MNKLAFGIVPALLACTAALADSNTDKQINSAVVAVFQQHPDLGGKIQAHTKDSVVYITGTVATSLQKTNAEDLVKGVPGVKKVVDNAGVETGS
jgi:osmotically-inducible protein OsmY